MLEQRVANRPVKGMKGVGLIALIALAVIVGSNFFYFLGHWIGSISSALFILYGIVIAWLLLEGAHALHRFMQARRHHHP